LCSFLRSDFLYGRNRGREKRGDERKKERNLREGGWSLERERVGMGGCLDARGVVRWLVPL